MSGQITSVNEPRENEHSFDVMSIDQASLSFKRYIQSIDKYDGKTQWRSIYNAIHDNLSEKADYFTSDFLKKCKNNPNVPQFILKDTNIITKKLPRKVGCIHRL